MGPLGHRHQSRRDAHAGMSRDEQTVFWFVGAGFSWLNWERFDRLRVAFAGFLVAFGGGEGKFLSSLSEQPCIVRLGMPGG